MASDQKQDTDNVLPPAKNEQFATYLQNLIYRGNDGEIEIVITSKCDNDGKKEFRFRDDDVRWGATGDGFRADQIIDSVFVQETRDMPELDDGYWESWNVWLQQILSKKARVFKDGQFKNIKPNEKIKKIFNIMVGSPLTNSIEKEVLRRGLLIFQQLGKKFDSGKSVLSQWHSILFSGVYSAKVFVIFDADRLGHTLTSFPTAKWSFDSVDKSGQEETFRISSDWMITRIPGKVKESQAKVKLPAAAMNGTVPKSNTELILDVLKQQPDIDTFLRTYWVRKVAKLTKKDVLHRREVLSEELGKECRMSEAICNICMCELRKDAYIQANGDAEKANELSADFLHQVQEDAINTFLARNMKKQEEALEKEKADLGKRKADLEEKRAGLKKQEVSLTKPEDYVV